MKQLSNTNCCDSYFLTQCVNQPGTGEIGEIDMMLKMFLAVATLMFAMVVVGIDSCAKVFRLVRIR